MYCYLLIFYCHFPSVQFIWMQMRMLWCTFLFQAVSTHCEKWTCRFVKNQNTSLLNPLQSDSPAYLLGGLWKGFSLYGRVKLFFRGDAVHTEPLLTLAQSALCHRINQKSWPQVAHRSHSHTMVSGWNSGCAHHMPRLQRGNQSPGVSGLPAQPPLSPSAQCAMPPTPH